MAQHAELYRLGLPPYLLRASEQEKQKQKGSSGERRRLQEIPRGVDLQMLGAMSAHLIVHAGRHRCAAFNATRESRGHHACTMPMLRVTAKNAFWGCRGCMLSSRLGMAGKFRRLLRHRLLPMHVPRTSAEPRLPRHDTTSPCHYTAASFSLLLTSSN
jgi:hypothetical protein